MKVNFERKQIVLTAKEMRKASTPYSKEYSELLCVMRDLPDYQITVKHTSIVCNKNRGLTYERMTAHIALKAPEMMDEFDALRMIYGYPTVSKWFRNRFPEVNTMECFCTTPAA